jgi:hypothetical protein
MPTVTNWLAAEDCAGAGDDWLFKQQCTQGRRDKSDSEAKVFWTTGAVAIANKLADCDAMPPSFISRLGLQLQADCKYPAEATVQMFSFCVYVLA